MKAVIAYYSQGGNTAWAAERIAGILGADLLPLTPVKQYPDKGFRKFFWGGKSAVMAETPALVPYDFDPEGYDTVILGFPVWAGNVAPPIRTFLRDRAEELSGKTVAAFACQGGAGAEKAFARLGKVLGEGVLGETLVLIDPKDRPDGGNGEKIREFCARLGA